MEQILETMRKLYWLMQKSIEESILMDELCEILSYLMHSNVYVVSRNGKILGVYYKEEKDSVAITDTESGQKFFKTEASEKLLEVRQTIENITGEEAAEIFVSDKSAYTKNTMIVPVFSGGRRAATLIFSRYEDAFSTEDVILGEYAAMILGIDIEKRQNRMIEKQIGQKAVAQLALAALSYAEIDAMQNVFKNISGDEALIVVGKTAERTDTNRTVILNGLKKLEGSGVIESKSLGMKGTHIRIINECLVSELERIDIV